MLNRQFSKKQPNLSSGRCTHLEKSVAPPSVLKCFEKPKVINKGYAERVSDEIFKGWVAIKRLVMSSFDENIFRNWVFFHQLGPG